MLVPNVLTEFLLQKKMLNLKPCHFWNAHTSIDVLYRWESVKMYYCEVVSTKYNASESAKLNTGKK